MAIDDWDEIRTAYHVARAGTVSAAAEALGVHHATVIRHVDALETRLGVKLFQRHARGYTATEAGLDLLTVAQATDDQFSQLVGRIKGRGEDVSGELVVTSLASMSPLLTPVLADFQRAHPGLVVRFLADQRVFRLEYGEAHVAIRAGAAPEEPDNVVQPFVTQPTALYASRGYVEAHGVPASLEDLSGHSFISVDDTETRAPFHRWLWQRVAPEQVVFRASASGPLEDALRAGVGIGFLAPHLGEADPDLVQIAPTHPEWEARTWLVTHVDLHRTTKVQAFLKHLKDAAKSWPNAG